MSMYWLDPFEYSRPSRLLNQRFGLTLPVEELLSPISPVVSRDIFNWPSYYRPWRSAVSEKDAGSAVSVDKDKFQVSLDVQQFKPDEITVKVTDNNIVVVEGKHEERPDEHGFISRQFVRKYILPQDHDIGKVQSSLSSDGVLTITAPKKGEIKAGQREIPITQTGQPSKVVENKTEVKEESKPVERNIEIKTETKAEGKPVEVTKEEKKEEKPAEAPSSPAAPAPAATQTPEPEKKTENPPGEKK